MGVEYFSLRFGVASPFLLKRTRVFLCLWSKPWFWKPEGLLFDSVEERLILACEWKNNCLCVAGFERVRWRLDRHCYARWWHTAALGQQQTTNQRTKLICNGLQECVYTCMYIYIYIYTQITHVLCAHTSSQAQKTQYAVRCPGRFAAWLVWKDYFPLKRQEAKWERFFWAGRWCRRGSDLMRTDTLKQLPNWNHLSNLTSEIQSPKKQFICKLILIVSIHCLAALMLRYVARVDRQLSPLICLYIQEENSIRM